MPLFDALQHAYTARGFGDGSIQARLRMEGWTAVDGQVPTYAVKAIVRVPKNATTAEMTPLHNQLFSR